MLGFHIAHSAAIVECTDKHVSSNPEVLFPVSLTCEVHKDNFRSLELVESDPHTRSLVCLCSETAAFTKSLPVRSQSAKHELLGHMVRDELACRLAQFHKHTRPGRTLGRARFDMPRHHSRSPGCGRLGDDATQVSWEAQPLGCKLDRWLSASSGLLVPISFEAQ